MWKSDPLWAALAAMQVGPPGAESRFTTRLARENDWSLAHAESVMGEYRRFLYLIARTSGPLTPSDDVDRAWHLHLLHSRHYWDILCGQILGRPLHHDPAGGGAAEAIRHRRQYQATLSRYRAVFGEDPPSAIWPADGAHLAARPVRIDAARYWLVPKLSAGSAGALAGATMLLAACTALAANAAGRAQGISTSAIVAGVAFVVVIVVLCKMLIGGSKRGGNGCGSGCSAGHGGDHGGDGCAGDGGGCGGD